MDYSDCIVARSLFQLLKSYYSYLDSIITGPYVEFNRTLMLAIASDEDRGFETTYGKSGIFSNCECWRTLQTLCFCMIDIYTKFGRRNLGVKKLHYGSSR